jgi:hypothetical protein
MARILGGVPLTGFVSPGDTSDEYPATKPEFGLGGLRTVSSLAERDQIPAPRREEGMLVYVAANDTYYKLLTNLLDWERIKFSEYATQAQLAPTRNTTWLPPVLGLLAERPGSPSAGDRYIIRNPTDAALIGFGEYVIEFTDSSSGNFTLLPPAPNQARINQATSSVLVYSGTTWAEAPDSYLAIRQGGNTFAAPMRIGTNDSQNVVFLRAGEIAFSLNEFGFVAFNKVDFQNTVLLNGIEHNGSQALTVRMINNHPLQIQRENQEIYFELQPVGNSPVGPRADLVLAPPGGYGSLILSRSADGTPSIFSGIFGMTPFDTGVRGSLHVTGEVLLGSDDASIQRSRGVVPSRLGNTNYTSVLQSSQEVMLFCGAIPSPKIILNPVASDDLYLSGNFGGVAFGLDGSFGGLFPGGLTNTDRLNLFQPGSRAGTVFYNATTARIEMRTSTGFVPCSAPERVVLPFAATLSWNLEAAEMAEVVLSGNLTLSAPTNLREGGTYALVLVQDNTGNRTVTFNSAYQFPNRAAPVISVTPNSVTILTAVARGGILFCAVNSYLT